MLIADNAIVAIPPFTPGTNGAVIVTGEKDDQSQRSNVQLEAFDVDGNRSNTGEAIITYALVNVNDRWFVMPTLLQYQVKTLDIGSALVAGQNNTVTVWGGGHRSQVMISDVMPTRTNTFAYPDEPLY